MPQFTPFHESATATAGGAPRPADYEGYQQRVAALLRVSPQLRRAAARPEIFAAARRPELSLAECVAAVMEGYADRPALGERVRETVTDPATGASELRLTRRFATISYRDLWSRAGDIAAEWQRDQGAPVRPGDFVATLGFISAGYMAVELACVRLGAVSVPLQAEATAASLRPVISEAGPRVLAVSADALPLAAEAVAGSRTVRRLVVFDFAGDADAHRRALRAARSRLAGAKVAVDTLDEVITRGAALPPSPVATVDQADPDPLSSLIYVPVSGGPPKGAMFTQRLAKTFWQGYWPGSVHPVVGVCYLPLSHVAGRLALFGTLASGGTAYFTAEPDLSAIIEDFELVRPTELALVPSVCHMLFRRFQRELDRRRRVAGADPSGGGGGAGRTELADEVRDEMRVKTLGGRVVWAASGGAPLAPEMRSFIESVLRVPLHDVYGVAELGAVLLDGRPSPMVQEYRLADVPELGYRHTDAPYPRGELLVKSVHTVPGYFNRPAATARASDAEGFYHTGDIMAEVEPGRLVYVNRLGTRPAPGPSLVPFKAEAAGEAAPPR